MSFAHLPKVPPDSPLAGAHHQCPLAPKRTRAKQNLLEGVLQEESPRVPHSALCHIPGSSYRESPSGLCLGGSRRPLGSICEGPPRSQILSRPGRTEEKATVTASGMVFQNRMSPPGLGRVGQQILPKTWGGQWAGAEVEMSFLGDPTRTGPCLGRGDLEGSRIDKRCRQRGSGPISCMPPAPLVLAPRQPGFSRKTEAIRNLCRPPFPKPGEGRGPWPPPLSPRGCFCTHLDPAVISIFNPRADDQLAVGFRCQVRYVPQKFLI